MRIFTRAVVLFALPLSAWAANLDTAFISQSVPAEMIAGQSVPVSVTLKNTGVWGWGPTSGHALGSQNPQNNTNWGLSRVPSTVWLGPGGNVTFDFNATAPATPGTYNFQWRMVHDAQFGWFGATTPNVAVQVVTPGAEFVSQTVPSAMDPGQTYSVSVTMKNTGSTAWAPGSYKLGSQNPQDNTTWGPSRAELAASVAPGNNGTFTFDVTAPSTPGSYDFQWRMVNSSFGWFGDPSTNVAVNVVTPGAAFVSQTVPSTMTPGQTYQVSVTMENTGASTWTAGSYRLGAANPLDNTTWRPTRVELASSVAPGNNGNFTFDVVAPTSIGAYNFQWRMVFEAFDWFGAASTNVQVAVGSASGLDFVHVDHLNTPRLVANGAGTTVWRWNQDEPFGNNVADEDPDGNSTLYDMPLRFPGQYGDKETNLHYNYFRDYASELGRYTQSDPIGLEAGVNTYAYVENGPLRLTDFFGLMPEGERGKAGKPSGTANPFKHMKPNPQNPKQVVFTDPETGKKIPKPKPAGFDEWWNKKHPPKWLKGPKGGPASFYLCIPDIVRGYCQQNPADSACLLLGPPDLCDIQPDLCI